MKQDKNYLINDEAACFLSSRDTLIRLIALLFVALCITFIAVAARINPDPAGHGTREQLGIPLCGFYARTGLPCPTCGMTTAFAHLVRGQVLRAFRVQPAGALAALACLIIPFVAGYVIFYPRCFDWDMILLKINWLMVLLILAAIVLLSWLWLCLLVWLRPH